jgi:hypothetical protein
MIGYGFGYDEELPAGFQDADIEIRELEQSAYDSTLAYWKQTRWNKYTLTHGHLCKTFDSFEALAKYCDENEIEPTQV